GIVPLACAEEPPAAAAAEHAAAEERTAAERRAEGLELFERRIRPLLAAKCYACHGPEEQENELRLDTHEGLLAGGVSGASLVPHKPAASLLITAVRYDDAALQMPPDRRLSAAEVAALTRWVELGMPHPEARDGEPAPAQREPEGGAQGSDHWAFQPLA